MDPYLEDPAFWSDFHDSFIVYSRDALNDDLPDHYEARVNERTRMIDLQTGEEAFPRPDIASHRAEQATATGVAVATALTVESFTIFNLPFEEVRETYIEIRKRPERTVVTVIELLSPSNKAGSDRAAYLEKRTALRRQGVNVVELGLLLGGERIALRKPLPTGDYFLFVTRAEAREKCIVYPWTIRQPLPTIPIPLKAPDDDIRVNLASVFTTTYDRGRYARALDYRQPPPIALNARDQEWAQSVVAASLR